MNPETWIPYQLAEDATANICIYDANGRMIRRMDIGYQSAGNYAVYWDGKNTSGEFVASGVYFYNIQTRQGQYSSTRKMVISQ